MFAREMLTRSFLLWTLRMKYELNYWNNKAGYLYKNCEIFTNGGELKLECLAKTLKEMILLSIQQDRDCDNMKTKIYGSFLNDVFDIVVNKKQKKYLKIFEVFTETNGSKNITGEKFNCGKGIKN